MEAKRLTTEKPPVPATGAAPTSEPSRQWDGYTLGFLRARGMTQSGDLSRVQAAVEAWFNAYPPQAMRDPFTYADAVIDCLRLRPEIPIEGPIAFILQCIQPPKSSEGQDGR